MTSVPVHPPYTAGSLAMRGTPARRGVAPTWIMNRAAGHRQGLPPRSRFGRYTTPAVFQITGHPSKVDNSSKEICLAPERSGAAPVVER